MSPAVVMTAAVLGTGLANEGFPISSNLNFLAPRGATVDSRLAWDPDGSLGPVVFAQIVDVDIITKGLQDEVALAVSGRFGWSFAAGEELDPGNFELGARYIYARRAPNQDQISVSISANVILPPTNPRAPRILQQRRLAAFAMGADRSLLWVPTRQVGGRFGGDYRLRAKTRDWCSAWLDALELHFAANVGLAEVQTQLTRRTVISGGFLADFALRGLGHPDFTLAVNGRGSLGNEWTPDDLVPFNVSLRGELQFFDWAVGIEVGRSFLPAVEDGLWLAGLDLRFSP